MKIEYHNAHGNQLILSLTPQEATEMISKITTALDKTVLSDVSYYVTFKTEFENDDDRWVPTDLDVVVEGNPTADCRPAFPSPEPDGKPRPDEDEGPGTEGGPYARHPKYPPGT